MLHCCFALLERVTCSLSGGVWAATERQPSAAACERAAFLALLCSSLAAWLFPCALCFLFLFSFFFFFRLSVSAPVPSTGGGQKMLACSATAGCGGVVRMRVRVRLALRSAPPPRLCYSAAHVTMRHGALPHALSLAMLCALSPLEQAAGMSVGRWVCSCSRCGGA